MENYFVYFLAVLIAVFCMRCLFGIGCTTPVTPESSEELVIFGFTFLCLIGLAAAMFGIPLYLKGFGMLDVTIDFNGGWLLFPHVVAVVLGLVAGHLVRKQFIHS